MGHFSDLTNATEKTINQRVNGKQLLEPTSIASERPGIADISPPTTLRVKSRCFCIKKISRYILDKAAHIIGLTLVVMARRGLGVGICTFSLKE